MPPIRLSAGTLVLEELAEAVACHSSCAADSGWEALAGGTGAAEGRGSDNSPQAATSLLSQSSVPQPE